MPCENRSVRINALDRPIAVIRRLVLRAGRAYDFRPL
jgi:hypothetical protein